MRVHLPKFADSLELRDNLVARDIRLGHVLSLILLLLLDHCPHQVLVLEWLCLLHSGCAIREWLHCARLDVFAVLDHF